MPTMPGLTPVGSAPKGTRQKQQRQIAAAPSDVNRPSLEGRAQVHDTYVRPYTPPEDRRLSQIAEGLATVNPALNRYGNLKREKQDKEHMDNARYYLEILEQERGEGTVTKTQVRELFPELSGTVAMKITQASASNEARHHAEDFAEVIRQDPSLRYDTDARRKAWEGYRAEALERTKDNPLYGSAYLEQSDKTASTYERQFLEETAAHHHQTQVEYFENEIAETLMAGGDIGAVDRERKGESSLHHREFNDLVVNTAINTAVRSGDRAYLSQVPDEFLNAESKKKLQNTADMMIRTEASQYNFERSKREHQRSDNIRNGQIEMLNILNDGETFNPMDYREYPELVAYGNRLMKDGEGVDEMYSAYQRQSISRGVLSFATTGSGLSVDGNEEMHAFFERHGFNEDTAMRYALEAPHLASDDRIKLIEEIPNLMMGAEALQSEDFRRGLTMVRNSLDMVRNDPMHRLRQFHGDTILEEIERYYVESFEQKVMDHIQGSNSQPNRNQIIHMRRESQDQTLQYRNQLLQSADENDSQQGESRPQRPQRGTTGRTTHDAQGNPIR